MGTFNLKRNPKPTCPSGKVRQPSQGAAEAQLRSQVRLEPDYAGRTYQCGLCGGWHIGRERPSRGQSRHNAEEVARTIVNGILDAVEKSGRFEKGKKLVLADIIGDKAITPMHDRLVEWTRDQILPLAWKDYRRPKEISNV
jgi:hypothetical protein